MDKGLTETKRVRDENGRFVKGHETPPEIREKIALAGTRRRGEKRAKGKRAISEAHKAIISARHKGRKDTEITRQRRIASAQRGADCHFWKGGVTPEHLAIRMSTEYRMWRKAVFERDNYTCIWCGQIGGKLNADHIKKFSEYPELRFDVGNGRTLCAECHKTTETFSRGGGGQHD